MKKIIYVTGCLGFIGSYFTRTCLKMGWYVKGIDKITYASNLNFLKEFNEYSNFSFEQKDINDLDRLVNCDYFVNFAAESHVDNSIRKSDDFIKSNINGVYNILQLLKSYKVNGYEIPRLYHLSTDEVFSDIKSGSHVETDMLKPSNPYSSTKAAADMLIMAWGRTFDLSYNIIRPTNNFGCGQYVEKLIPRTCKYLSLGKKIELHNNGTPVRVWLHAQDTTNAILKVIESGVNNEIYNVSGNYEDTNINVVKKIIDCYFGEERDVNDYINLKYHRIGQDVRYSLNDGKIKKLGWKNECNFDEELPKIVDYYKQNFIW